ncbi:MAG: hypothetical protein COA82_06105 [Alkaliphilus sp.]|nr:MAG: hypothetical protein COA82_06105 [Alkaliphilus sp.]
MRKTHMTNVISISDNTHFLITSFSDIIAVEVHIAEESNRITKYGMHVRSAHCGHPNKKRKEQKK